MSRVLIAGLVCAGLSLSANSQLARAAMSDVTSEGLAGSMRAEIDGKEVLFPSLKTDVTANVQGDLATVTVIQTFTNPSGMPLNATYLFPLNKDAAVYAMDMQVGDETVSAKIEKKAAARQIFEQGKREGKAAALLEQHRPNMFTQSLANLMPGLPITVTLKYVETVPRVDGEYQLTIPLVVGPRYMPVGPHGINVIADSGGDNTDARQKTEIDAPQVEIQAPIGEWSFGPPPQYPEVTGLTIPATIDQDRVAIRVNLTAAIPIANVSSQTHAIATTEEDKTKAITLAAGRIIDNRDFVLRYAIASKDAQAGLLTHRDADGGVLSLMIEPPRAPDHADITPREIVFLLDTSGSMSGQPIEASKTFMRQSLQILRSSDYFRIIQFSNIASEFTTAPVRADAANLASGLAYVESLQAGGGTEMMTGLQQAFSMPQQANARRILVFLSDGYVGNEAQILRMVAANIGKTRTYVFGIGTSVNHYLLSEMAHQGRGFVRVVDPTENSQDAAMGFANKLRNTVMTDVAIDWGDLKVSDVTPEALPDLFEGDAIRVQGRFAGSGRHVVKVTGKVNGRAATLPIQIELPTQPTGPATAAIPLVWARSQIADEMRLLMTPQPMRASGRRDTDIETRVTDLGLKHSLTTQWTSFVAVSQRVVNVDPGSARDTTVPLPMVKGVGPLAYGQSNRQALAPSSNPGSQSVFAALQKFSGSAAPEPEAVLGLTLYMLALGAALLRRRLAAKA